MRRGLPARRAGGLPRSRDGLAALEFALILPVLIIAYTGLYDAATAFLAWQRVIMAAEAIAEIATAQAVTAPNTNILTLAKAQTAASAIYAYMPDTIAAPASSYAVVITSVAMTATPSGCTTACTGYAANVAWSGIYQGSYAGASKRACGSGVLTSASDTAASSAAQLPADVLNQGDPVLVVDVYYTFNPLFLNVITGSIVMEKTAYFAPRTGLATNWIQYYSASTTSVGDSYTTGCISNGYPWSPTTS